MKRIINIIKNMRVKNDFLNTVIECSDCKSDMYLYSTKEFICSNCNKMIKLK